MTWTIQQLRRHLQTAIELEHSTLPPYMCALYSIKDGHNRGAASVIRSVLMEEMLHLTLAANVLNAVGGSPSLNHRAFVPSYPTFLPHSDDSFQVGLQKFCPAAIDTFLEIEMPARTGAPPEGDHYHTIGQFYAAIKHNLHELHQSLGASALFCGARSRQMTPEHYYGGGGAIVEVHDLNSADQAIDEIVNQGEGIVHTIFDGDQVIFHGRTDYAHYFRFNEIKQGRYYTDTDTPRSGPTGASLPVDWEQVHNMRPNPKASDHHHGSPLWNKSMDFNHAYTRLLNTLHDTFNGDPDQLRAAVGIMYELKYRAVELMNIPVNHAGETAGPPFELITHP